MSSHRSDSRRMNVHKRLGSPYKTREEPIEKQKKSHTYRKTDFQDKEQWQRSSHHSPTIEFSEEIEQLFEKKFRFEKPSDETWSIDILPKLRGNEEDPGDDDDVIHKNRNDDDGDDDAISKNRNDDAISKNRNDDAIRKKRNEKDDAISKNRNDDDGDDDSISKKRNEDDAISKNKNDCEDDAINKKRNEHDAIHKKRNEHDAIHKKRNEEDDIDDAKRKESYETLSALKLELNTIKDSLSDNDITTWHEHTRFMHTAGAVIAELRNRYKVELCTQAFCKFYEMVYHYPLVPSSDVDFHSVHLCEAPGAFITALNHYLKLKHYHHEWDWIASTLSPYYEGNSHNQMIDDDRFIRGTLNNWYFGEDGTGNLMCEKNIAGLEEKSSHLGNILLVTADGSIDCQDAPSEQESLVSRLHYYETLTALKLLQKDGSFVLKVFTMFETDSITLMYILNCCFKRVNVIKPGTSKPGNSEVYVVSQGFTGEAEDAINFIQNHLNGTNKEKVIQFPASFLEQHAKCCSKFVKYQCNAIRRNLHTYRERDWEQRDKRDWCKQHFVDRFEVKKIELEDRIVKPEKNRKRPAFKLERRFEPITFGSFSGNSYQNYSSSSDKKLTGSFNERKEKSNLPWHQRVKEMVDFDVVKNVPKIKCTERLSEDDIRNWKRITEVSIDQVQSSRFVDSKTLDCLNEIKPKAQILPLSLEEKYKLVTVEMFRNCDRCIISDGCTIYCLHCEDDLLVELVRNKPQSSKIKVVTKDESLSNVVEMKTLFCQIVRSDLSEVDEEVKEKFLSAVTYICKNLQQGDNAVLYISTCLTRFSAGLVYILARCFTQTSIKHIPSVNLEQVLYLKDFMEKPDQLDEYLEQALRDLNSYISDSNSSMTLGEILPLDTMISDTDFTTFLKETNQNALATFINSTIAAEKKRFQEESLNKTQG